MKRLLVFILGGVTMAMAWWMHPSEEGLRTGEWRGRTTQALPVKFFVAEVSDGLVIDEWKMRVDLDCESTGRIVHGMAYSTVDVPIRDGRFLLQITDMMVLHNWKGIFTSHDDAHGEVESAWPALIGSTLKNLETEKCIASSVGWTARPGAVEDAAFATSLDFVVRIERDGRGAVLFTFGSPSL